MLFFYGSEEKKFNITDLVYEKCLKDNFIFIPAGDFNRAAIFGDPLDGVLKSIFIQIDENIFKFKFNLNITINSDFTITTTNEIKSAIVCIAKFEKDYITHFVNYHLKLGFDKIFIYDNEDQPLYHYLNSDKVIVIHIPGNNYYKAVQYVALEHFINNYINQFTHVAHIDIDEYIVLKKHTLNEFINKYITNDCAGIAMNWRHFGSNGQVSKSEIPDIFRFTKCEESGNHHIKTIFDVKCYAGWDSPHSILTQPNFFVKNTKGDRVIGPFNENIDFSVVQINHYKCKTLSEFEYIRTRGRADLQEDPVEDVFSDFNKYNFNEIEDYSAAIFYSNLTEFVQHFTKEPMEGYCEQVPQQIEDLLNLLNEIKPLKILEIGFNAGHSSELFLKNSKATVVSFDLGYHSYVYYAKKYIDYIYPDRHTLILGDSNITIKQFNEETFDIIFIDGGHDYECAKNDIINCKRLAHSFTIVIMDDTMYNSNWVYEWNKGPTKAWEEANFIKSLNKIDYTYGRGMSWGKYII